VRDDRQGIALVRTIYMDGIGKIYEFYQKKKTFLRYNIHKSIY